MKLNFALISSLSLLPSLVIGAANPFRGDVHGINVNDPPSGMESEFFYHSSPVAKVKDAFRRFGQRITDRKETAQVKKQVASALKQQLWFSVKTIRLSLRAFDDTNADLKETTTFVELADFIGKVYKALDKEDALVMFARPEFEPVFTCFIDQLKADTKILNEKASALLKEKHNTEKINQFNRETGEAVERLSTLLESMFNEDGTPRLSPTESVCGKPISSVLMRPLKINQLIVDPKNIEKYANEQVKRGKKHLNYLDSAKEYRKFLASAVHEVKSAVSKASSKWSITSATMKHYKQKPLGSLKTEIDYVVNLNEVFYAHVRRFEESIRHIEITQASHDVAQIKSLADNLVVYLDYLQKQISRISN